MYGRGSEFQDNIVSAGVTEAKCNTRRYVRLSRDNNLGSLCEAIRPRRRVLSIHDWMIGKVSV